MGDVTKRPLEPKRDRKYSVVPPLAWTLLSAALSLIVSGWEAFKAWRRGKKVDEGNAVIQSDQGEGKDYDALDEIEDGVYHEPTDQP
jgi:hypothetical protein